MCCALGRPVYHVNACLANGLCEDVTTGWIWRESCTDPTWEDPRCLKLCMEESESRRRTGSAAGELTATTVYLAADTGDAMLTACADGSYCCGNGNATCCEQGLGYAIVDGQVIPAASANLTASSASNQVATGAATAAVSASASATQASPSASSISASSVAVLSISASSISASPISASPVSASGRSTLSIGLGVGLGVGLPLAAAILALAVVLMRKRGSKNDVEPQQEGQQSRQETSEKEEPKYVVMESELAPEPGTVELHGVPYQPAVLAELSGEARVFEK